MQLHLIDTLRKGFATDAWALVIGDLMLDRYLWGKVERISPEAPVPVVLLENESSRPGGAANVAANLTGLGLPCWLLGGLGDDAAGLELRQAIAAHGVESELLVTFSGRPTITKTRVVGGHQQILRLDRESSMPLDDTELEAIDSALRAALEKKPSIIVLSDYAKGMLHPDLCRTVIERARANGIPVLVDPKGRDYDKYQGATILTPNRRETSDACGGVSSLDSLLEAAEQLRCDLNLDFLAITRSEEGISLLEDGHHVHIPAMARQVFDVSGAGDTVIATLAAGMVAGLAPEAALHLANLAAGIVVGQVGTVPIRRDQLLAELLTEEVREQADKVCDLEHLLARVARWRAAGERIVFTNGCFDLLHAGHVTYLEGARKLGDRLVVGLNTDRSVSALKGPSRPVIHEADRARVMAALEAVAAVILFDQDTPLELIHAIRPDVLAKGSDYSEDQVVGGVEVKSWGGKVALVELVPGRSTSGIIGKLGS